MLSCPRLGATPNPLMRPGRDEAPRLMSLAPGCLFVVGLCVATGYAAYRYLPPAADGTRSAPAVFAGFIGLLGGMSLSSLVWMIKGHGRGAGSRAALHARAKSDEGPQDRDPIIATGLARSDRPLTSPIGGVPCAAYDYRMYTTRRGSKGRPEEVPVYWGYAAQPFAIDSRSRRYPLAGVPFFTWEPETIADDAGKARARTYVRSTGWETIEFGMLGTLDTVFRRVGDDSRTAVRKDFALSYDEAPDVALLTLEERVLPLGATISAFGTWSGSLGSIVAPPSPLPGSSIVIAQGGPDALDGAPGVPQSMTSYVVTMIVMGAIAGGLFWLARIVLPTMQ